MTSPINASDHDDCLRELHALLVEHFDDFDDFVDACLVRGQRMLALATGIVSRIDGQTYGIVKARSPLKTLRDGARFDLGDCVCIKVLEDAKPVAYAHAGELPDFMRHHPVYVELKLESYLAVPIHVGGTVYGTLSFSDTAARPEPFTVAEIECIEAMAALLGRFIEAEQTRQALAQREHLFEQSFRHALIGKALATVEQQRILDVNPALCRMFGRTRDELIDHTPDAFTHPDDLHVADACYRELLAGEREWFEIEKRYLHADGHVVHAGLAVAMVRDAAGQPWLLVAQIIDLSDSKRRERQLQGLLDAVPDALVIIDETLHISRVNDATRRLFGHPRAALVGQPVAMLMPERLHARQLERLTAYARQPEQGRISADSELYALRADGTQFPCELSLSTVEIEDSRLLAVTVRDIGERLRMQDELKRLAASDPLTGLANRRAFDQALAHEHARLRRASPALALVMCDLDHFKRVNDRYGHDVGDRVLARFARVLRDCARETDLPARLGGEEFAVLLPDTDLDAAGVFAERLRLALHAADWPTAEGVTASLGVAALCDAEAPTEALYRAADEALYAAKGAGRDRVMRAPQTCIGRLTAM